MKLAVILTFCLAICQHVSKTTTAELNEETTTLAGEELATTTVAEELPTLTPSDSNSQDTDTENLATEQEETTTIFSPTPAAPETTTDLPTTTTDPAEVLCSQQTAVGRHPYPNDTTCRNYVYCYTRRGVMQTRPLKCPNNYFYNSTSTLCARNKPQGCI